MFKRNPQFCGFLFYFLSKTFSNNTTEPYITAATIASIITPVITRSSWNTWPPYTIR